MKINVTAVFVMLVLLMVFNTGVVYRDSAVPQKFHKQLGLDVTDEDARQVREEHFWDNNFVIWGNALIILVGVVSMFLVSRNKNSKILVLLVLLGSFTGCRRPFEPINLQIIQPYEEAFLIPFNGDPKSQQSSHTEDFLKKNLVYTQQVKIPQQWVSLGYENVFYNGEWRDAAILIKVDKSPVTREWTADATTGTSDKNEAIWVMTSDQVEFSTGWTCTARIASREDSIKFLANYPNGSLEKVMDREMRGKLQATFGLAVTDRPMDELRKEATPHIQKTVDDVTSYFHERGITITNLGITGGFVYKDPKIIETMVKLFNSEQEKMIAKQKAEAILTERQAEADGIKLVADAKFYEIEKMKTDSSTYMMLKQLELRHNQYEKWDGKFPQYFMSGGGNLDLLFQVPDMKVEEKK